MQLRVTISIGDIYEKNYFYCFFNTNYIDYYIFIAIGTVRDSRYYILILVYIIVYKIILSFTNRSKKSKQYFSTLELNFIV